MLDEKELDELESRLKDVFSDYYELGGGKNYRYHHLTTVRKIALKIAKNVDEEFNSKVLEISALFHDIGRKEDINDGYLDPMESHEGHAETGAEIVSSFVSDFVDEEEMEKIEIVIGNHHSEPETVEGKILQDADLLDNFGVSDLWRMFHYSSDKDRTLEEAINYFWSQHVGRYVERLDDFNYEYSRQKAKDRLIKHQESMRQIEKESQAGDL